MMKNPELLTANYDYKLDDSFIASSPVYPRDEAKLLVYNRDTDSITHTKFKHLLDFIPKNCDIIINDTKVIKARIFGHKKGVDNTIGGKIEILFNKPISSDSFLVFIRGRVRVGSELIFDEELEARVIALNDDGSRVVKFSYKGEDILFEELILVFDRIGHTPLPPYIHREDNSEDEIDYQTLFAKNSGAVAAPTASLHFTDELFEQLQDIHEVHRVTLHVGAGTFKSVESEEILDHTMHSEYFDIPKDTIEVIKSDREILAIGTTVTRAIEYHIRTQKTSGECDLFLNPSNLPQRVTHLLTNFHLPKSTLIMLVSAFVGREKTLALYQEAIREDYRFFSYGDAMLIL